MPLPIALPLFCLHNLRRKEVNISPCARASTFFCAIVCVARMCVFSIVIFDDHFIFVGRIKREASN